MNIIKKAYDFAYFKHFKQLDDTGKPYFTAHIKQVVSIISKVTDDENLIAAAYLHDTIEDTETTIEELVERFGADITCLVLEVTHNGNKSTGYYFPRLKTQRGIMLKLADRLSNISRMEAWSPERKQHYLKKTRFWKRNSNEILYA